MATTSNEEIIEKSATSPIASSCLVIACVALLGAIAFQVAEIASYKTGVAEPTAEPRKGVAQDMADKYISGIRKEVEEALAKSARGGEVSLDGGLAPAPGVMPDPDEPADDTSVDAEPPADEPSEEEPSEEEPAAEEETP